MFFFDLVAVVLHEKRFIVDFDRLSSLIEELSNVDLKEDGING